MINVKACILTKLIDANQLLFVFLIMHPDLGQQAPTGSAALTGDAFNVLRVYANSFDFHNCDSFVSCCKFTKYSWINEVILAMLDKLAILDRLMISVLPFHATFGV